nr:MAG TPA: hypothetical protein [Caudoviricetes sp.]
MLVTLQWLEEDTISPYHVFYWLIKPNFTQFII